MDHTICINKNSFTLNDKDLTRNLFDDAIQGILELQSGTDRFLFYLDSDKGTLYDFQLANNYTFEDFMNESDDIDLISFLSEVIDKSPALDNFSDEEIEELASYSFYIKDRAMDPFPDVYGLNLLISGYLLSINTEEVWSNPSISVSKADQEGKEVLESFHIKQISSYHHGVFHTQSVETSIQDIIAPHEISKSFTVWFDEQTNENQHRIKDKLRIAKEQEFYGTEPFFKKLEDAKDLWEIRFFAHAGGCIRILYKDFDEIKKIILVGFIKKSNREGYATNITRANDLYDDLKKSKPN